MSLAREWIASGAARVIGEQEDIGRPCPICGGTGISPVGLAQMRRIDVGMWACVCAAGERAWRSAQAAQATAQAALPAKYAGMTLDTYAALGAVKKSVEKTRALREVREWLAQVCAGKMERPWLLLQGRTGRGKTGLAVGAMRALAEAGRACRFVATFDMLDEMKARFGGDVQEYTDALASVDVLVVDELVPPRITDWNRGVLFELVYRRDARQLVTVWTTAAGDDDIIAAIGEAGYRRLKENSRKVVVEGNEIHYGR